MQPRHYGLRLNGELVAEVTDNPNVVFGVGAVIKQLDELAEENGIVEGVVRLSHHGARLPAIAHTRTTLAQVRVGPPVFLNARWHEEVSFRRSTP